MASVITTGSFPKLLWPGIHKIYQTAYKEYMAGAEWKQLFQINKSDKAYEEEVGITGMGLASAKPEGEAFEYDSMKQAYVSRYTNITYATGYIVTEEELEDNLYMPKIKKGNQFIAFSMHQTKENICANIYNRAFDPFSPGGDSVSLVNDSHPIEGGTVSNTMAIPADLSEDALEQAINDIGDFRDNRNNHISIKPLKLVVPYQLQFEATRILKNPERPDTANRDINALYSMGVLPQGFVTSHYFDDPDAWFILTDCPDGLKYFERIAPDIRNDNDFDTTNIKVAGRERYCVGWSDFRQIYGSPGAGA